MDRIEERAEQALEKTRRAAQELKEGTAFYCENGLKDRYDSELYELFDPMYCVRPYAMEVWLWLWKAKDIPIDVEHIIGNKVGNFVLGQRVFSNGKYQTDPEEAIIAAIEYLCENNLIK